MAEPQAPLAKGQLWKTDVSYIYIVELGKRLVHYKMLRQPGQPRRTQMTDQLTLEGYLKTNQGRLVEKGADKDAWLGSPSRPAVN